MSAAFDVGIMTAILAGALSFLSPCVLPLIPGYLSFITGLSLAELTQREERAKVVGRAVLDTIVFVVGFSVVFILLGASATTVGLFLKTHLKTFAKVAGVGIIILGLHMTGVIRVPFLYYEKRLSQEAQTHGILRALLAGLFFAFGWTPCVGPILAGILAIAATEQTVTKGIVLLSAYSLGLGVLFILSAIFMNGFFMAFSKIKKHLHKVEVISGCLLIVLGVLIFANKLSIISSKLAFINPEALMAQKPAPPARVESGAPVAQLNGVTGKANYGPYDFELKTLDGRVIRLSNFAGKAVLVNFWAPWCPPCRAETPAFVRVHEKYKSAGLVVIGVGVQTNPDDVQEFVQKFGMTYLVGIEAGGQISDRYGIFGIPASFLFAPDGQLYQKFEGYTDEGSLESKIKKLLIPIQSLK
ncbi:MAG: redoxin domain-containing protein [Acidobacteria bacterium]|nr:redoxin domain-containing protein [Acidobacteriota bacterium]